MHGKITYFSSQNGLGTITNKHKRVFELKKKNWHDPKTIPSSGMYVVFRYDEREGVTDCKASYCQSFENNLFLKESDFWDSEDDEMLKDIEERRQEELVLLEMGKIDLKKLKIIKPNRSLTNCLQNYFQVQIDAINKNSPKDEEKKNEVKRLDYFLIKRFIDKALNQLLYFDKRITMDDFAKIRQKLVELEYLYTSFSKQPPIDDAILLDEVFLKYQVTYLAIAKKLQGAKEELLVVENRIKSIESEITALQGKIAQAKEGRDELVQKLNKRKSDEQDNIRRADLIRGVVTKVEKFCNNFLDFHKQEIPKIYNETKGKIKDELRYIIDRLAYDLDYMIWKRAMSSDSIEGTFYKQDIDGSFCSMTFLRYYLKRLDKTKMQQHDKILYGMMQNFEKNQARRFAIVTEHFSVAKKLKLYTLGANKDYCVTIVNRPVEFLTLARSSSYDVVLVDKDSKGINPVELIVKCKKTSLNPAIKFILFSE